ncbi:DUF1589 domain-containing protein, partial [Rhodopirellula baltica]
TAVGQVITWHPADALEQSEASNHTRKTRRSPSNHPARYNLAYDAPVTTRRVSKTALRSRIRQELGSHHVNTSELWRIQRQT